MAVDSNVLIFERIKEEMRGGKTVPGAISAGFDRALVTIIDTHVTKRSAVQAVLEQLESPAIYMGEVLDLKDQSTTSAHRTA
jgi:hypothetical protein